MKNKSTVSAFFGVPNCSQCAYFGVCSYELRYVVKRCDQISSPARDALRDADMLADLAIFHADVRENVKEMSKTWEM